MFNDVSQVRFLDLSIFLEFRSKEFVGESNILLRLFRIKWGHTRRTQRCDMVRVFADVATLLVFIYNYAIKGLLHESAEVKFGWKAKMKKSCCTYLHHVRICRDEGGIFISKFQLILQFKTRVYFFRRL